MNEITFQIRENEGCIELTASGELSAYTQNNFRLHLVKLLMYGKSKSYKLNLRRVASIDASCVKLIHILNRQLTAVKASLVIEMPENSSLDRFVPITDSPKKQLSSR